MKLKLVLSLVLALLLGGMLTNAALAFHCSNPNVNENALVASVNLATGEFTPTKPNWGYFTEEGEPVIHGAWVELVFPWGASYNVWVQGVLPDGAMNAGPGDDRCDGIGIDDMEVCLAMAGF